ncbi:unnamed protein product [Dibothriocephalus latus]|uniref:Galactose-1-phosphate uridyl transferase N-terminal domain-containing protein n=1 Tax=Dibothriocephalus latus TaxID=60516 RepID=A0A3P7N185_DIBLA|nr:unnamed protein product [Dibothriocephalus latus]
MQRPDPTASGTFVLPPADRSHRRYNPLTQEWVIVSPNRLQRPWSGAIEKTPSDQDNKSANSGDAGKPNPLAPGASRPGGVVNPNYTSTYTFKNDFPALVSLQLWFYVFQRIHPFAYAVGALVK